MVVEDMEITAKYLNHCYSYYCDVCESLTDIDAGREPTDSITSQLKGINCPKRPGFYTFRKDDYLPWLLYENEMSCLKLIFDVCEKPPRRINYGGRTRYTCEN
uniref:CUB domain-containing protein n=1 Tax=Heterorhabditis bacteriophora TaxID=37862 RepID=A0A1I7XDM2_HETBA